MKSGKHIALCGITAVLIVIAVCINDHMKKEAEQTGTGNSYGICINEVCSAYFPTSFAETQPPSDWIELYNFSNTGKNLGEYYLSDDKDDLHKYKLPEVELLPGSYYVIHCEYEGMTEEEECLNFRIKAQGETIYLTNQGGGYNRCGESSGVGDKYILEPSDGCGVWVAEYGIDLSVFQ